MRFETAHAWYLEQVKKGWQKWFAWYPVDVDPETTVWLETIERRITVLEDSRYKRTATYKYRLPA